MGMANHFTFPLFIVARFAARPVFCFRGKNYRSCFQGVADTGKNKDGKHLRVWERAVSLHSANERKRVVH
jgi:hypothetical protein